MTFSRHPCIQPARHATLPVVTACHPLRHPRMRHLRHPRMRHLRHPRMRHLRHPRMLLSGDLLNRLFKRSQTVWEIPDRYFVSSGMTRRRRSRLGGRDDRVILAGVTGIKIVIPVRPSVALHATDSVPPACATSVIPACHPLRHPRMLLSGDLLKRLFKRNQTVWEIPDRYFVSSGMTGGRRSRLGGRDD